MDSCPLTSQVSGAFRPERAKQPCSDLALPVLRPRTMSKRFAPTTTIFTSSIALFSLSTLWTGCAGADNSTTIQRRTDSPSNQIEEGPSYWELEEDGWVLAVEDGAFALLEPTNVSCLLSWHPAVGHLVGGIETFFSLYEMPTGTTLSPGIDFEARNSFTGDAARFSALSQAPSSCEAGTTGDFSSANYLANAERDFETLWYWFEHFYPFWDMYGVDRDEQYGSFRSRVNSDTSTAELASVLQGLFAPLDDGHVEIYTWQGGWEGLAEPSLYWSPEQPKVPEVRLQQQFEQQDEVESFELFAAQANQDALDIIVENYLEQVPHSAANGVVSWGKLGNSALGYLAINEMAGILEEGSMPEMLVEVDRIMESVMADLGSVGGMVVDVRRNGGGFDRIALQVASHFARERGVAYRKRTYRDDEPGREQHVFVEPSTGARFEGPVAVLTSDYTISAAEIFAMTMDSLPQVTLIGETTNGALSNTIYRRASGRLVMSLPVELYYDVDGVLREDVGVDPDIVAPMLLLDDRIASKDSALDLAIEHLTPK